MHVFAYIIKTSLLQLSGMKAEADLHHETSPTKSTGGTETNNHSYRLVVFFTLRPSFKERLQP